MGISDHDWQERRKAISDTLDNLGDEGYRNPLREGWLKYIKDFYREYGTASEGARTCNLEQHTNLHHTLIAAIRCDHP